MHILGTIFVILMTSFLMCVFIFNISYMSSFLSILFFTSFFFSCPSSCTRRRNVLSKALVFYCFLACFLSLFFLSLSFFPYWQVHFHRSVLFCPFTHHHGPFLLIFTMEVTWVHEMKMGGGGGGRRGGIFIFEEGGGGRGWGISIFEDVSK